MRAVHIVRLAVEPFHVEWLDRTGEWTADVRLAGNFASLTEQEADRLALEKGGCLPADCRQSLRQQPRQRTFQIPHTSR